MTGSGSEGWRFYRVIVLDGVSEVHSYMLTGPCPVRLLFAGAARVVPRGVPRSVVFNDLLLL